MNVLIQGGPAILSICSSLCKQLHEGISESTELHRGFAQECFAVTCATDWRAALLICCKQWQSHPALPSWAGRFLGSSSPYQIEPPIPGTEAPPRAPDPLAAAVVAHTDQVGHYAQIFPPSEAVHHNGSLQRCWCTSTMHDRNCSLLVRLDSPALVTGVGVVNPAEGFDCPVKLLLAFASMEEPAGFAGATQRVARFMDGGKDAPSKAAVAQLEAPQARWGAWGAWGRLKPPAGDPIVAIHFPGPPACDGMHIVQPCAPTAARWVHFLIVSAYNPNHHDLPNIDVCKLQVFGIPLDQPDVVFSC